jgi:hypothetical protein
VLRPELRHYEGADVQADRSTDGEDPRDAVMDLVIADKGDSSVIISIMNEDEVDRL